MRRNVAALRQLGAVLDSMALLESVNFPDPAWRTVGILWGKLKELHRSLKLPPATTSAYEAMRAADAAKAEQRQLAYRKAKTEMVYGYLQVSKLKYAIVRYDDTGLNGLDGPLMFVHRFELVEDCEKMAFGDMLKELRRLQRAARPCCHGDNLGCVDCCRLDKEASDASV